MFSTFCYRCSKTSFSVEGLHCFYCNSNVLTAEVIVNFRRQESEPVARHSSNNVPAANDNTQTVDENLKQHGPTQDSNISAEDIAKFQNSKCEPRRLSPGYFASDARNKTMNEIFMILEPTRISRIQNENNDFYFCDQVVGIDRHDMFSNSYFLNPGNISQDSYHYFSANGNPQPENACQNYFLKAFQNVQFYTDMQVSRNTLSALPFNFQGNSPVISHIFAENYDKGKVFSKEIADFSCDVPRKRFSAKCGKCKKSFISEKIYHAHILNNCDPKIYKCDECDIKCRKKCDLLKHQRVHTREKPYKCSLCGYKTAWSGNLKVHMIRNHSDK